MIRDSLRAWARALRALVRPESAERELDDELRYHVDMLVAENVAAGMDPDEARRVALLEFGGLERTKEDCRDERRANVLADAWRDLRFGVRSLARDRAFTAVALSTLAVGIAANTAVFSVVSSVLLQPLPFPEPDRLVVVQEANTADPRGLSYPNFLDVRSAASTIDAAGVYNSGYTTLTGAGETPERVAAAVVSANVFDVLGVRPRLGRGFREDEDRFGGGTEGTPVVLGDAFWRRRFGADEGVLGRSVTLDGRQFVVVGVMPAGFRFPLRDEPADVWLTVGVDADPALYGGTIPTSRGYRHYDGAIARLRPGVTLEQARAELGGIAGRLKTQYSLDSDWRLAETPALERLVGDTRPAIVLLFAAVCLVLLIACVNVANLLLARSTVRDREIAVRTALGARRGRVVRQLVVESALLALVAGAIGLALAYVGVAAIASFVPADVPRAAEIGVDWRVAAFATLVSLGAGVIFGLAPALGASKVDLTHALKEGGRSGDVGAGGGSRAALVAVEVALAVVLLVGSGLLLRSFARLHAVDPGFDTANVLSFGVTLPETSYPQGSARVRDFTERLVERARALPGVRAATAAQSCPLGGEDDNSTTVEVVGDPPPAGDRPAAGLRFVGPGYFGAIGIPVTRGRDFTADDGPLSSEKVVVNEAFVRRFFDGADPVGRRLDLGFGGDGPKEIVGVVADIRHESLEEPPGPAMYVPMAQFPINSATVIVRADGDPRALAAALEGEVRALDRDLPVYDARTLDQSLSASVARPRFVALLGGLFALVALALACVGVYGVVSYSVARRTHEIGIRTALGARAGSVVRMVVRQGMVPVVAGAALGVGAAAWIGPLMNHFLYDAGSGRGAVYAAAVAVLGAVALAACYLPARRAARVDPLVALRRE